MGTVPSQCCHAGTCPILPPQEQGISAPSNAQERGAQHLCPTKVQQAQGWQENHRQTDRQVPAQHLGTSSLPRATRYLKLGADAHSSARQARLTVA